MSEKKEWVTIKIPEPIRDKARTDNRTYGEIMQAGLRDDSPEGSDTEAILHRLNNLEDVAGSNNVQREEFREDLAEIKHLLEQIQSAQANTVEAALGEAESAALSFEDVVSASEAGARAALDDYQR